MCELENKVKELEARIHALENKTCCQSKTEKVQKEFSLNTLREKLIEFSEKYSTKEAKERLEKYDASCLSELDESYYEMCYQELEEDLKDA